MYTYKYNTHRFVRHSMTPTDLSTFSIYPIMIFSVYILICRFIHMFMCRYSEWYSALEDERQRNVLIYGIEIVITTGVLITSCSIIPSIYGLMALQQVSVDVLYFLMNIFSALYLFELSYKKKWVGH